MASATRATARASIVLTTLGVASCESGPDACGWSIEAEALHVPVATLWANVDASEPIDSRSLPDNVAFAASLIDDDGEPAVGRNVGFADT